MSISSDPMTIPAVAVTRSPKHHYFGYYEKFPWDASGRWMLGMETDFMDHPPVAGDVETIGLIDTQNGNSWTPIARTRAWNWQQGCMLQWIGDGSSGDVIFNDCVDGKFVSRILNVHTKKEQVLGRPIYAVNRAGTHAVSLNFSRLQHQRPGYGYPGVPDPWMKVQEPEDDGLFLLDLKTGGAKLILSTAQVAQYLRKPAFDGKIHRFNHVQFGADPRRFAFLHRYKGVGEEVGSTRLMTVNIDGSELCCLSDPDQGFVSHYDWKGSEGIIAWSRWKQEGDHYFYYHDKSAKVDLLGERHFSTDGHCSYSPNREWILTDTYPDKTNHRTLMLYHVPSDDRIDIGRFYAPPMDWQIRCDLHPRWSRDGKKVCIDSIHEGTRQIYVLDVKDVVESK